MRKKNLAIRFIDAWVQMDIEKLSPCLSSKVKCHLPDKDIALKSRKEFLQFASKLFRDLKTRNAAIIPVSCENGNYYELIYSFYKPALIMNNQICPDETITFAEMELRKEFVITHVYFEFNLFRINMVKFSTINF